MRTRLSKEERKLVNYEHILLNSYEKYLKMLHVPLDQRVEVLVPTCLQAYSVLLDKLLYFNNSS